MPYPAPEVEPIEVCGTGMEVLPIEVCGAWCSIEGALPAVATGSAKSVSFVGW